MVIAKGPSVSYRRPNKIGRPAESAMSETRERVHIEDGPKRVGTYLGGEFIADRMTDKSEVISNCLVFARRLCIAKVLGVIENTVDSIRLGRNL